MVLRLAGFGYPTTFLLKSSNRGESTFVQNDQFGWRFFGPRMARLPDATSIPREKPPNTVEEQLQLLRAREPVPEAKVKEMEDQRMAATKERLVKREGIQDKRLIAGEPNKPPGDAKEGMVEFTVGGMDE